MTPVPSATTISCRAATCCGALYWPTDYVTGDPWTARYGSYAYNPVYYNDPVGEQLKNSKNTCQ